MANKPIRILTNAADFVFNYEHVGRSVTDPTDINNRMPGGFFGAPENAEYGVPQLVYCENVLPYAKGVFSVSYTQLTAAFSGGVTTFDQAITLRDTSENQFTFSPAKGANYVLNPATGVWTSTNPFAFNTGTLVTRAYVNGRSFVCYEKASKILEYVGGVMVDFGATLILPPGLTYAQIRGIGHASNYLLLFSDLAVYWCSPLNILDFNTIDQGAGQSTPTDIKGLIVGILQCGGGFIAYTARNAIAAKYTNNGISPFVFKEVSNAGGVQSWEQVTADSNETAHFIWGTNGLQQVGLDDSVVIHPEVADFLVGGNRVTWNKTTKAVEVTSSSGAYTTKLSFLGGRYLVISYGELRNSFDGCLVYDTALKRWGKLVVEHVDVFQFVFPSTSGDYFYADLPGFYADLFQFTYADLSVVQAITVPPKTGFSFLKSTGQIDSLVFNFNSNVADGVAIFGRFQQRHDYNITVTDIEIDGLRDTPTYTVSLLGSEHGLERDTVTTVPLMEAAGKYKRFSPRVTARNFDLAIEGNFVTSSVLLSVINNGYR